MDDATRLGGKLEDVVPQMSREQIGELRLIRLERYELVLRLIQTWAGCRNKPDFNAHWLLEKIEEKCKEVLGNGKTD